MKKLPIAVQVYSVRGDAERDFKGTMQKLKDMGYEYVELAGLYEHSAQDIRRMLDEVGIPAISAHVPYVDLLADTQKVLDDYKAIGCKYVVVPYLTEELRPGTPAFVGVMEGIKKIGAACKQNGLILLYHNHDFEFERMESGEFALDYIYEQISANILQTELDTCWVNVGGVDPAEYIKKYSGRCPVVHLKDFVMDRANKPKKLYELIGIAEDNDGGKNDSFNYRPLGMGLQNMPEVLATAIDSGAEYVVIEQDESADRPPMEAMKISIDYLRTIM